MTDTERRYWHTDSCAFWNRNPCDCGAAVPVCPNCGIPCENCAPPITIARDAAATGKAE